MSRGSRSGLVLAESIAAVAAIGILIVLLAVAMSDARRNAGLGTAQANLGRLAAGAESYAATYNGIFPTYSWRRGQVVNTPYADLAHAALTASFDFQAMAAEFAHYIRAAGEDSAFPVIQSFVPHFRFGLTPLLTHLGLPIRDSIHLSPGDRAFTGFNRDTIPLPGGGQEHNARWRYAQSFELGPTWYSPEEDAAGSPTDWQRRIRQTGIHNAWLISLSTPWRARPLDSVPFPSQKAMFYDRAAWYFGPRVAYWAHREARIPMSLADGSVHVRTTAEANRGWNPIEPRNRSVTRFVYAPDPESEPRSLTGVPSGDLVDGHYRWTRGGALGRDFGPELPPG